MINEAQENSYLTVGLYERSFGAEASGDFILPDHQGEIRKILHVSQTVLPPARYVGSDTVEFNGTVDYQVIYVGTDGEMYSVPLSSEYGFSVPLDRGEYGGSELSVLCSVTGESVNTRVSAPRRLSIRSRLRPNVRIYAKAETDVPMPTDVSPMSVYENKASCTRLTCTGATSDVIPVSCTVPLTSGDVRIINADAKIFVSSHEYTESGIACRGTVYVKLLAQFDDGADGTDFKTLRSEIPFDGEIELGNMGADCISRVRGILSELSVSVAESGVECNAGIVLEAVACLNESVEYIDDVYSTEAECDCTFRALSPRRAMVCSNVNFTVSERIPLTDTAVSENAETLDAWGAAYIDKCTAGNGGGCVFSGNATFSVLYRDGGELQSADISVPVSYEAECNGNGAAVCFDGSAEVIDVKVRTEQGKLCIDAELAMSMDCFGETAVQTVDRISVGDVAARRDAELTVCYPEAGDTLWTVAKRYRVAPASVLGNPMTDKYVIID